MQQNSDVLNGFYNFILLEATTKGHFRYKTS